MTEETRELGRSKDTRVSELKKLITDVLSCELHEVFLVSFNEPNRREAEKYDTPPPDFREGGLTIEKINFKPGFALASVTLIKQVRDVSDPYNPDIGQYIQVKTADGRKYFFATSVFDFPTLRDIAFTHEAVKDSFVDTSFQRRGEVKLLEEEVPNYWKTLSGYTEREHDTYESIHAAMLIKLKEQLRGLPPETKVRLSEIGCGTGELLKKALEDPEIKPYISSIGLLDLHAANVKTAITKIKDVWRGSFQAVARGMPDGIDELASRKEGEYSIVLSSGSLTQRVLTRTQAVETVAKLHEKADNIIIGGLTQSWINKKIASLLGYKVSQIPKISVKEISFFDSGTGQSTPMLPEPEASTTGVLKTVKSVSIDASPSTLVTVLRREDREPQLSGAMVVQYNLVRRESLPSEEEPEAKPKGPS